MTYFNPAPPYRALHRSRPLLSPEAARGSVWLPDFLRGLLALLYAKGFLSAARLKRRAPRVSCAPCDFKVTGCDHLRAALEEQGGQILGDLVFHDRDPHGAYYGGGDGYCAPQGAPVYPLFQFRELFSRCNAAIITKIWLYIRGSPILKAAPA